MPRSKGSTAERVAIRTEAVRQFLYRGFTRAQIATTVKVPLGTVDEDLRKIRRESAQWWGNNRDRAIRERKNLFIRLESLQELKREAWIQYMKQTDSAEKRGWHMQILRSEKAITDLEGLTGISNVQVELERVIQEIREDDIEIRRLVAGTKAVSNLQA